MGDVDFAKDIDEDEWYDIESLFKDDATFDVSSDLSCKLEFVVPIASGFRFRYQSEIDKKSFSALRGEKSKTPSLYVLSPSDAMLQLDLITEISSSGNAFHHFNTLYEVSKLPSNCSIVDGICLIPLKKDCGLEVKLDNLGIRKWKLKEAIPRIQQMYPKFNEKEAKLFFNDNKTIVKLRASLIVAEYVVSSIISNAIESRLTKENKMIKIQHISPKTVADYNESLIIVLEKKITCKSETYLIFEDKKKIPLVATHSDGQTFVFTLPVYSSTSPAIGKVRIECPDYFDEKPIRFEVLINEARKRKNVYNENNSPLKKPTHDDSPRTLYPETGYVDIDIENDGIGAMDTSESHRDEIEFDGGHVSGNESCKDSGIYSADKDSCVSASDDDDGSSDDESDDDSEVIEIEGVRRRRVARVENLEPINFQPPKRPIDSHLQPGRTDRVAQKIFSEVARIGHDFAFGKQPEDLFFRIEKQLPVVFTLQDDVGDTPLNNALLKGNVPQAERILKVVHQECSWALDIANTSGHTALILAPACDVPATFISKLLEAGCKLEATDDLGKSAIIYAIEYKNTAALSVLLQYIQEHNLSLLLQRHQKSYFTPLQIAVINGYVEGVRMMLDVKNAHGNFMVDVNELALMNDDTALHVAVERNVGTDIVKLLLDRPDIDLNHKKNKASTVLHIASKMKLNDIVLLLKSHDAEDINERVESEEIPEAVCEEMEDDEEEEDEDEDNTVSATIECDVCPVVEMATSCNIAQLIASLESMSLKGDTRTRLIDILLTGDSPLTVAEFVHLMRPGFATLVEKYGDSNQERLEMIEVVARFNCLPNSVGQLFEGLREINRYDVIERVAYNFNP